MVSSLVLVASAQLSAQFTYGHYLEPPTGEILQGIGQFSDGNDPYLDALDGYSPAPYPGHEMVIVNIQPDTEVHEHFRPFDATAASALSTRLAEIDAGGRIPHVAISFLDYVPLETSAYLPSSHDSDLVHDATIGAIMEGQISLLGETLADFDHPVFVRIGLEFNNVSVTGGQEGYHPYDFPVAVQITHDLLVAEGARCAFIWCWEASAPTDYADVDGMLGPKWYPGDEYVDWFGLDIFATNEFTTASSPIHPTHPSQFDDVEDFLDYADTKGYPVFVAESSCVDYALAESATDDNGSWDGWFDPYLDFLAAHPGIEAIDYISHDWTAGGGPDDWLDATVTNCDEVLDQWVDALLDPGFLGADSGPLLNGYDGWWGLGNSKAGGAGRPKLAGAGEVLPDAHVGLVLSGAAASVSAGLYVGYSAIYAAFKGGVLVPNPDLVLPITTNGSGGYTLTFNWPSVASPGDTIWFQYWILEDSGPPEVWAASNAIKGVTL